MGTYPNQIRAKHPQQYSFCDLSEHLTKPITKSFSGEPWSVLQGVFFSFGILEVWKLASSAVRTLLLLWGWLSLSLREENQNGKKNRIKKSDCSLKSTFNDIHHDILCLDWKIFPKIKNPWSGSKSLNSLTGNSLDSTLNSLISLIGENVSGV